MTLQPAPHKQRPSVQVLLIASPAPRALSFVHLLLPHALCPLRLSVPVPDSYVAIFNLVQNHAVATVAWTPGNMLGFVPMSQADLKQK